MDLLTRQVNVQKKNQLIIKEGNIRKEFDKLHKEGNSLLTTANKFLVFCGLLELTDKSCVHVELQNPTDKTIIFNIRTPASPVFFVKPHVGMVEPKKKVMLYFTFKGRCHRVPSDFCWIYSIYHIVINRKDTMRIKEDEFSSSTLRTVWNEQGKGEIENILHLSCIFDDKQKPKHECRKHKIERRIFLNDTGEVLNAGTMEDSKDAGTSSPGAKDLPQKPSAEKEMETLPKTAESEIKAVLK